VPTNRKRDLGSKKVPRKVATSDKPTLLSIPSALPGRFTMALSFGGGRIVWLNTANLLSTPSALPGRFIGALRNGGGIVRLNRFDFHNKLFTPKWEKNWEEVAGAKQYKLSDGSFHDTLFGSYRNDILNIPFSEHVPDKRKIIKTYERIRGGLKHFSEFKERNGFTHLKALGDKVAPNFILSLFICYLWEDRYPLEEHKDWQSNNWFELKSALQRIRQYCEFSGALWHLRSRKDDRGFEKVSKNKDTQGFERVFSTLEKKIEEEIEQKDFSKAKRGAPRDKENRVIFALYEHIKQVTGSPQWATFFDLLLSAGAITTGEKKRREGHENDPKFRSPDTRIRTRINSFKRNHPKETQVIKEHITPTILSLFYPDNPIN